MPTRHLICKIIPGNNILIPYDAFRYHRIPSMGTNSFFDFSIDINEIFHGTFCDGNILADELGLTKYYFEYHQVLLLASSFVFVFSSRGGPAFCLSTCHSRLCIPPFCSSKSSAFQNSVPQPLLSAFGFHAQKTKSCSVVCGLGA